MCGAGAFARAKWGESLLIVARKNPGATQKLGLRLKACEEAHVTDGDKSLPPAANK